MVEPIIRVIRCDSKYSPCPHCGKKARRVRRLQRTVRSLAYKCEVFLDIRYAEYKTKCSCCKSFRSNPPGVEPKAEYDNSVRIAVLDRILDDGLNVERTRVAMKRDFLLDLSSGFVYDCLNWQLRQIDLPAHYQRVLASFSGLLCIDEVHLGQFTVLLATDPISDEIVGFAQVGANDGEHMRRFLLQLKGRGFLPNLVITDGSNLYPGTLAEVWPDAKHQLCVFHVIQDITDEVLAAVRRLRGQCQRRGQGGRKRKRGRPRKGAKRATAPNNKEKAAFVFKRRYLIVKRQENLSVQERADLQVMLVYIPELRTLWQFSQEVYKLWNGEQTRRVARWRWNRLKNNETYQAVPELQEILTWLTEEKFTKTQAFLGQPEGKREKTNNHVERANRKLRFAEKVRFKWRKRKSVVRYLLLQIGQEHERKMAQSKLDAAQATPTQQAA